MMPIRDSSAFDDEQLENLRLGTRQQYTSDWTVINDSETHTFTHNLGEIPWIVDVAYSEQDQGGLARDANSDVTVVKTSETITCTSNFSAGRTYYFQVRAM
jgi:hypothetical protein